MPNFGKRINQVVNERWDLPDGAASLMQLQADTLARIEAGDLGVAEGVLSRSEVTFETVGPVKRLRLGGCLLYGCKPDDTPSNLSTAAPVVYDPTDPNQTQSTVDITSLDGSEGAIWWSVALAPTDLANRRVWEAGYPDGRNQPILTRETPRVIFQTTSGANFDTPPATGGPWYRFAAVDFNASPPTVVLCHALDFGFEYHAFAVAAGTVSPNYWLGQIALNNRSNSTNVGRSYSVARLLTQMSLSYLQTLDSRLTYDVETCGIVDFSGSTLLTAPERGIVQLNEGSVGTLATYQLTWDAGDEEWTFSASAESSAIGPKTVLATAVGAGHLCTLAFTILTDWVVTGIHVQPQVALADPATNNVPVNVSVQSISTLPIAGNDGLHTFNVLMQYWDSGGEAFVVVDTSFTFTIMGGPTSVVVT